MPHPIDRRSFLAASAAGVATFAHAAPVAAPKHPLFKISLAQWSLNKAFFGRGGVEKLDPLKFAEIAKKDFGIDAIEYVNQFYKDKKKDDAYLNDLKKAADDNGVKSVLIMCDGEGDLGDADDSEADEGGREPQALGRVGEVPRLPLDPRQRPVGGQLRRAGASAPPTACAS